MSVGHPQLILGLGIKLDTVGPGEKNETLTLGNVKR